MASQSDKITLERKQKPSVNYGNILEKNTCQPWLYIPDRRPHSCKGCSHMAL
ncbi:hypothetical protein DPMN_194293 [Dreissena polymorpha]|uniref:Uncharacterized protein n=1 Tax=Dreissena polymorpha TaxID=45954 RepID=A0A9D3Y537_DREPO|nr:hypothetical protein DPMN_194293 [Dreissena polymorpha]